MISIYQDLYRTVYKCNQKDLDNIEIWEGNRGIDNTRVSEIESILKDKKVKILPSPTLEGFKRNGKCYLIDGAHRLTAMKNSKKPIKFLLSITNVNETEEFKRINKGIPVPETYTEISPFTKTYEDVVNHYKKLYPKFFMASRNPVPPHVNKDSFIQMLFESKICLPKEQIIQKLDTFERQIKQKKHFDGIENEKKFKKSIQFDFWLFWAEIPEILIYLKKFNLIEI